MHGGALELVQDKIRAHYFDVDKLVAEMAVILNSMSPTETRGAMVRKAGKGAKLRIVERRHGASFPPG
jgi:hypothetical protein